MSAARHALPETLINYIKRVKQAVPAVPGHLWGCLQHVASTPDIMNTVDVVYVNYYPYWEGISVDQAVAAIHQWHRQITATAGGKPLIIGETGWPSDGVTIGQRRRSFRRKCRLLFPELCLLGTGQSRRLFLF